jgi:hypothetical protein
MPDAADGDIVLAANLRPRAGAESDAQQQNAEDAQPYA